MYLLAGSKSFHSREEVETLRAALTAIEWPEDELSVFATLKGSLFAIPDSLLLRFHHEHGRLHPFNTLTGETEFEPITEALQLLADLHRGRNRRPIADTVTVVPRTAAPGAGAVIEPVGPVLSTRTVTVADVNELPAVSAVITRRS